MARVFKTHIPTLPDVYEAKKMLRAFQPELQDLKVTFSSSDSESEFTLNEGLIAMLRDILMIVAKRKVVAILPHNAELTYQETTQYLNVSRDFLMKEIEKGHIRFRRAGTHRRFSLEELLKYQNMAEHGGIDPQESFVDLQKFQEEGSLANEIQDIDISLQRAKQDLANAKAVQDLLLTQKRAVHSNGIFADLGAIDAAYERATSEERRAQQLIDELTKRLKMHFRSIINGKKQKTRL